VAHRLSTIALADRVILVEAGRVVADGTHRSLLATDPRYAAVLAEFSDSSDSSESSEEAVSA
jgi:ATP-binding cassette subfamily B protein